MSRTDNSLRNLKTAVLFKLAAIVVNFIARKIFVVVLTKEYLGLDGTFANILTMLSLAELGVGTAITYSMYKPLAEGDRELILSLMTLYRKFYTIIGITVGVLGAALTPFLQYIIRDIPDIPHIRLIYLMFVLDSSISYFLVYKQSLISADQKQHIVTSYQYKTSMAVTAAQCAALLLTGDYILYLALKLCATFVCNALLARKADRLYPYLKQKTVQPLPAPVRQDISKNIRAMIAHKLGSVVVFGTDNVLIAYFVGAVSVGLYSNYLLITQSLKSAYSMIFRAMTASIGNLCAAEDTAHAQAVFWRVDLLTRWIYGFSTVCLVVLFNPFISLWLGADYLFSMPIVLLIVLSFYVTGMRQSVLTFREAMGLYWYDRHKPLFESAINLAVSILLAKPVWHRRHLHRYRRQHAVHLHMGRTVHPVPAWLLCSGRQIFCALCAQCAADGCGRCSDMVYLRAAPGCRVWGIFGQGAFVLRAAESVFPARVRKNKRISLLSDSGKVGARQADTQICLSANHRENT